MLIRITENDLHNIIKECLTEVVSKASYMKGYANNKGEHIPYSEIRYQQKYQTDDNNKKPRALSILVIKTIVDSYCKDVKIYRNNQDALLKIVRKLRNKVINGEGYKETIYNESTNGKTHILFDINNPHKPMYQFYIKYDSNSQNDEIDKNNFRSREFYEWLKNRGIVLEKPKRQRISRNTEDNSKYYSNWDMIVNHSIKKWNKMRQN